MISIKITKAVSKFSAKTWPSPGKSQVMSLWLSQRGFVSREPIRHYFNINPPGSGAGRGGGSGGSVRESGGGLGQFGAANEEEYFFNKRKEQLEKIKSKMKKELKSPQITRKEEK